MTRQEFIEQVLIHNQFAFNRIMEFKTHPLSSSDKDFEDWAELHIKALVQYANLLAEELYGDAEQPQEQDPLDKPIEIIAGDAKGLKLFSLLGVKTIREFVDLQKFKIPAHKNIGKKTIWHISDELENDGYFISGSNGVYEIMPLQMTF